MLLQIVQNSRYDLVALNYRINLEEKRKYY